MSRQFGESIPERNDTPSSSKCTNSEEFFSWIRNNEIGKDEIIETPFGKRKILYCDYSASARAFGPIEEYIQRDVLPLYGNTHSSVTVTAEQTTLFIHEARQELRALTGAGDNDDVIFCGSGSTAAVELLLHIMDLKEFVVIHSKMEHHSNLLPWRKTAKKCFPLDDLNCLIDPESLISTLEKVMAEFKGMRIICAFTACSNLTGICSNVELITRICKTKCRDSTVIWDYASAAPSSEINVNGSTPLDAIFFSGHKLMGGVSTPGVLVIKKSLIKAKEPKRIGGGTVSFVSGEGEWFLKEAEHREEGGTPDAVGIIRLALAVKLKRAAGAEAISHRNHEISKSFISHLSETPEIVLLGPPIAENRHPIFSFLIRDQKTGLFFHHNYISALLNDLYGIQSRAGCMCAGPFAQELLGIGAELAGQYQEALKESDELNRTHLRRGREYTQQEMLRPGFTRISIPYFWSYAQVSFVLDSIKQLAKIAGDFLHLYQLNAESGEWHHEQQRTFHARKWLGYISFSPKGLEVEKPKTNPALEFVAFEKAHKVADGLAAQTKEELATKKDKIPDGRLAISLEFASLRWFVLPIELLHGKSDQVCPFSPKIFEISPLNMESLKKSLQIHQEKKLEKEETCLPCQSTSSSSSEEITCPLNADEKEDVRLGEFGTDESPEETKELEDWSRRVIVTRRELTREEERQLPWVIPPLDMYKRVSEAIHSMEMIMEGDKVLVCLSGGKDSLALLHILHHYRERCKKNNSTKFELGAITVDPGSTAYNPRPLIEYCRTLNIDYFYEEQDIIGLARKVKGLRSICAFCSRLKRGRLAAAAVHHGWNVLAMGQHLDDIAESFFIAAFQNGNLSTMKAQYTTRDTSLRVIRPLVFVREKALRDFAESSGLPIVAENCPACFNQATERHRMKQLLAQQELIFPELFNSLRAALRPLMLVDSACTDQMRVKAIENIAKQNRGRMTK